MLLAHTAACLAKARPVNEAQPSTVHARFERQPHTSAASGCHRTRDGALLSPDGRSPLAAMQQSRVTLRRWRDWMVLCLCALAGSFAFAFSFDDVAREADRLARLPYRQPAAADPAIAALSYDAYRKQRFRADQSIWRGTGQPFELQYFPLGRSFTRPLTLYEVVADEVRPLRAAASMFEGSAAAGVAGVRLHHWV